MYRMFFAHLKPTMTIISVYFLRYGSPRETYVDLKVFEVEMKELDPESAGKQGKKTKVSKRKAKKHDEEILTAVELIKDVAHAETKDFVDMFHDTLKAMIEKSITRDDCLSKKLHIRILAASGVRWNRKSKYHVRDYTPIALAVVLESLFLKHYRLDLLNGCHVAYAFRVTLGHYFDTITKTTYETSESGQVVAKTPKWSYADTIPNLITDVSREFPDPEAVDELLEAAYLLQHIRKDSTLRTPLEKLLKSDLILCADTDPNSGRTVETVAYLLITWLVRVSDLCFDASLPTLHFVSTQLTCLYQQIMALIREYLHHDAVAPEGTPFQPTAVRVPDLIKMPHAVTEDLKEHVSTRW
jgi:hypothetical protein